MLENRPILQRSLVGVGAFSFVFAAAMAGTAFMISGGIGLGGHAHRASSAPNYAAPSQAAWNAFAPPASAPTPVYVTTSAAVPVTPPPSAEILYQPEATSYASEEALVGDAAPRERQARSEQDILRGIQRELATYESDSAPAPTTYRDLRPAYDPDVVAAKEAAADRREY